MSKYSEQFKRPEWQKKRLQIMERDAFECVFCKSGNKTLNVHHTYYESGLAPWEYPDTTLLTTCEDCHTDQCRLLNLTCAVLCCSLAIRCGGDAKYTIAQLSGLLKFSGSKETIEALSLMYDNALSLGMEHQRQCDEFARSIEGDK